MYDKNSLIDDIKEALANRDFVIAIKKAEILLAQYPEDSGSYRHMSNACNCAHQLERGERITVEGIAKFPNDPGMYACYARLALSAQNYEDAAWRWGLLAEKFPETPQGYTGKASALAVLGRFQEVDKVCREGISRTGKHIDCWQAWGDNASRQLNYPEAIKRWETMRVKFPQAVASYFSPANARIAMHQFTQAEELCLAGTEAIPDEASLPLWLLYAEIPMNVREYEQVIKRCATISAKFPEKSAPRLKASRACMEMLDFAAASALVEEADKLEPDSWDVLVSKAGMAARMGNDEERLEIWRQFLAKFPNALTGLLGCIDACLSLGNDEQADEYCKEALAKFPENPDAWCKRADMAMRMGDYRQARKQWAEIMEKFPYHTYAYIRMSTACSSENEIGPARRFNRQAQAIAPYSFGAINQEGELAMLRKDYRQALQVWEKLRRLFPHHPNGYVRAANALQAQHEDGLAQELLDEAVCMAPYSPAVYAAWADAIPTAVDRLKYWQEGCTKFPNWITAYKKVAYVQIALFDYDGAEKTLRMAKASFVNLPDNMTLWITYTYADLLGARGHIDDAFAILRNLYESSATMRRNEELVTRLGSWWQSKLEQYKGTEDLLVNDGMLLFVVAVYISNDIAIRQNKIFQICDTISCRFGRKVMYQLLINAKKKYQLDNFYSRLLTCTHLSQELKSELKLFLQTDLSMFHFYIFMADQDSYKEIVFEIFNTGSYIMFPVKALWNYIRILTYLDTEKGWIAVENILSRNYDDDVSTLLGFFLRRLKKRNRSMKKNVYLLSNMPKRLKVAICCSGQLRGYRKCFSSLFDTFDFENHDYKVFVHTWEDIGCKFPTPVHANRVFNGNFLIGYLKSLRISNHVDMLKYYYPTLYRLLINNNKVTRCELVDFYQTDAVIIEDDKLYPYVKWQNWQKMYYKICECYRMTRNEMYDIIVRVRPDMFLRPIQKIKLSDIYRRSLEGNLIFTPHPFHHILFGGCDYVITDAFAIGASHIMGIYSTLFSNYIKEYSKHDFYRNGYEMRDHPAATYNIYANGIDMEALPGISAQLCNAEYLAIEDIFAAIENDAQSRSSIPTDAILLEACRKDMAVGMD